MHFDAENVKIVRKDILIMNRVDIIQAIINRKKAEIYLEIGFGYGDCFLNIRAPRKIIVDPRFIILKKRVLKYYYKNISKNIFNKYYKMTSDKFFTAKQTLLKTQLLDVVFLDGLHTYKQSLKDLLNSLKFLNEDGVIILHDCNPRSEAEAYPANSYEEAANMNLPGWTEYWSGDVWKTTAYLRSIRDDLNIFVLNFDHGIGIITKGIQKDKLGYSREDIENLSYKDLERNREQILNLKTPQYFEEFLKTLH